MNIDTPYFRTALTIAVVWIVVFAYLSYSGYRGAYRSMEYAAYDVPEEDTYECNSDVLDATKSGFQFRAQTSEEQSECYQKAAQQHFLLIESGNRIALERAWKSFGLKGTLPAILLLAIVAFWTLLSTAVGRAGSSYVNWLRFGLTKSDIDRKQNKP